MHELSARLHPPIRLSFGSITYADTGLGSAFSLYLEDQILLALRNEDGITIITQVRRSGGADEGSHEDGASGGAPPGAPLSSAPLVLTGTFFGESAGKVPVFLRVTDPSSGEILGNCSFALDRMTLPSSLDPPPANHTAAVATKATIDDLLQDTRESPTQSFQVRVWTDRGEGATYLDGEDLTVNFATTRDCHIRMYHIDAAGHATLILPNQYWQDDFFKAGRIYQIPPQGAPYRFQLHEPYGVEFIKVIASTGQFSNEEQAFVDLGPVTRGLLTRGLSVTSGASPETSEALVSYTILALTSWVGLMIPSCKAAAGILSSGACRPASCQV